MLLGIPDPRRVGFEEQVNFLRCVSGCADTMPCYRRDICTSSVLWLVSGYRAHTMGRVMTLAMPKM
jgi:hypothetical protein